MNRAKTKRKFEPENRATIACDCINNAQGLAGNEEPEAKVNCRGIGQSENMNYNRQEGINAAYPKVTKKMLTYYIEFTNKCLN